MIEKLLAYQNEDAKLKEIENEISSSEARVKAYQAKIYLDKTLGETVATLDKKARDINAVYQNAANEKAATDEAIQEIESAIESSSDENEINYLLKKVDELLKKASAIESEINKIAENAKVIMVEFAKTKKTAQEMKEQLQTSAPIYKKLREELDPKMEEEKAKLLELEKGIDPKMMELYKAKRKDKAFPIVYKVNGIMCGKCFMEIPASVLSKMKKDTLTECDHCHCLLYVE